MPIFGAAVLLIVAAAPGAAQYSTPMRDVENPNRAPFELHFPCSGTTGGTPLPKNGSIPAGKRFIVEYVSGLLAGPDFDDIGDIVLAVQGASAHSPFGAFIESKPIGSASQRIFNAKVWLPLDSNSAAVVLIGITNGALETNAACGVNFHGHLAPL